ncbi:MAG: 4Fe-4S cluster-binding domain-containing protein, partial [Clostridia bacterium]|nr:4Fe-4S cluster-binding domain-containing protein [Clostridia bacterium]
AYTAKELFDYVLRYKNYILKGGVTFSGGEPFLQAEFCRSVAEMLREQGIDTAAETNGHITDKQFISALDLLIVDIKNQSEIDERVTNFLNECGSLNKKVIITNVIIKGINDSAEKLLQLKRLTEGFDNIQKIKFLPFKKLCLSKYKQLNIDFPYKDKQDVTSQYIEKIEKLYYSL